VLEWVLCMLWKSKLLRGKTVGETPPMRKTGYKAWLKEMA